jgi:hypothetical protein
MKCLVTIMRKHTNLLKRRKEILVVQSRNDTPTPNERSRICNVDRVYNETGEMQNALNYLRKAEGSDMFHRTLGIHE